MPTAGTSFRWPKKNAAFKLCQSQKSRGEMQGEQGDPAYVTGRRLDGMELRNIPSMLVRMYV
jgi:hypothetical protein